MKIKITAATVLLMVTSLTVSAQTQPNNQPIYLTNPNVEKAREDRIELARIQSRFKRLQLIARGLDTRIALSKINAFNSDVELSDEDVAFTKPDADLYRTYGKFLTQKNTGLLVLLPDLCAEAKNAAINGAFCKNTTMPDKGRSYSFRRNEYQNGDWADLQFTDGAFVTNGTFGEGWLGSLGDVALENVSVATKGVGALASFVPASNLEEAEKQYQESVKGFEKDGILFKKFLPVKENNTYILRSVAFDGEYLKGFGNVKVNMIKGDTRKDVLVAFRVVKKNADGSLTLLWKELERKESPKLKIVQN